MSDPGPQARRATPEELAEMRRQLAYTREMHRRWASWPQRLHRWLISIGMLKTIVHYHSPFDPCTDECKPKKES